jgi:hypothetical protein
MPPTFAYFLALIIWVFSACIVWLAAGVLYFVRRTRSLSKPLSLAMAGTFPFVFAYQILAAPIVAVVLLATWAFWKSLEPAASTTTENPLVIVASIGGMLLSLGMMLAMSLAGFYKGWRTGWACGNGRHFQDVLWEGPTTRLLHLLALRARRGQRGVP